MNQIILASASPRRISMMKDAGLKPVIMPSHIEETLPPNVTLTEAVMFLSLKKALWVEEKILKERPELKGAIIIAADTLCYKDGFLGKPKTKKEAYHMISLLKNTFHEVSTGVTLLKAGMPYGETFAPITRVYFKDYSHEEILEYINTAEPYDKAGGYGIQGTFSKYIERIDGSYDNVVGFPFEEIKIRLTNLHVL